MDTKAVGNLEKWKADFARKQEENTLKAKLIQQETMNRRRAMEMKAKFEAAKEERRRQEALAERRANHVEATMRFQKGLKHFKVNRERISLEQVLRDIQPRSRKTSVDNPQNQSARSNLKKTHSFENLNSSMSSNNTLMSNSERSSNGKFGMKKVFTPVGTKPIVIQKNSQQQYNPYDSSYLNAENSNLGKDIIDHDFFDHKHNNMYIDVLQENQKNLQDINKEALKEFENLVSNQLNIENNNNNNNYMILSNGLVNNNDHRNNHKTNNYAEATKNVKNKVLENNYIAYEKDDKLYRTDFKSPNNQNVAAQNEETKSCNESMDADSLLNESISSEYRIEETKNDQQGQSNQYTKNYEIKQVDSKNIFNVQSTSKQNAVDHFSAPVYQDDSESIMTVYNDTKHREVKGILKRTASLDNPGTFAMPVGFTPAVNFGIERTNVKDSIVLANQRIKNEKLNETIETKKNVRFATNLTSENVRSRSAPQSAPQPIANISLNNIHVNSIQALIDKEKVKTPTTNEQPTEAKTDSITAARKPVIKQNFIKFKNSTTTNPMPMPIPKLVNMTKTESETQANSSSKPSVIYKPPVHPNSPHHPNSLVYPMASPTAAAKDGANNSYALLSQRRKDQALQQKKPPLLQKQLTPARLNSPKTNGNQQQPLRIEVSHNIALQQHLNANYSTSTPKPTSISSGFVNPINQRQPAQSPIQSPSPYFPMPVFNQSENSTPILTNHNNYKMVDNNYREFQQSNKGTTNPTVTLPQYAVFARNQPPAKLQISNYPEASNSNMESDQTQMNNKNQNVNITKIPLSPKSTLNKTNPYLVSDKNSENRPTSMPNTMTNFTSNFAIARNQPMSTPVATQITATINQNSAPLPKNNIRFNYVNHSPNVNNNLLNNSPLQSPHANMQSKRILSADSGPRNSSHNNTQSHLTSFPLFSDYHQPTNIKRIDISNNNATESLAAFLTAEEMSNSNGCTESQILNTVDAAINNNNNKNNFFNKNVPVNLSVEEQNVKNSILRLNDRLNVLKEKRSQLNHVDIDAQNTYNETLNVYNNSTKPIDVTLKSRR